MKDRFRFRAWDIEENRYYNDIQDCRWDEPDGELLQSFEDCLYEPDFMIEQCTGLKDKNGKLIYEGDILKSTDECFLEKYKVEWISKFSQFTLIGINTVDIAFGIIYPESLEIIGNIHKNPELLEVK